MASKAVTKSYVDAQDAIAAAALPAANTLTAAMLTAAARAGAPMRVPKVTGRYYAPAAGTSSTLALQAGFIYATPFWLWEDMPIDRIAIQVTTAVAATTINLGAYLMGTSWPGVRIFDAGTVDSTATGAKELTVAQTLPAGLVWLTALALGGAPTVSTFSSGPSVGATTLAAALTNNAPGLFSTGAQTGLADPYPGGSASAGAPKIVVRAA